MFKRDALLLRLLFTVLALLTVSAAESFDKPTSKSVVPLGRSTSGSGRRAKVTCYFYPQFMVKEVDRGEKGADRLSIVPITSTVHHCTAFQTKAEMVINADEWSGYFKGVKKDLVFFDGDDLVNGGMGFAVYDAKTGKRIFEDSTLGHLEFSATNGPQISLKYTRVVDGQCIVPKDQAGCWEQIRKTIGLDNASPPDCKQAYEQSAQKLAKGRCQAQNSDTPQCVAKEIQLARDQTKDATSIIAYPVEVTLGSQPSTKPITGELKCWPSD